MCGTAFVVEEFGVSIAIVTVRNRNPGELFQVPRAVILEVVVPINDAVHARRPRSFYPWPNQSQQSPWESPARRSSWRGGCVPSSQWRQAVFERHLWLLSQSAWQS